MLGASRTNCGPEGAVLFGSDIRHRHTVCVRLFAATRSRGLHNDRAHAGPLQFEIEFSEAQWASFVSSMNVGDGVPCTVRYRPNEEVPELPYAPRLAQTMAETRQAAHDAFDKIQNAFAAYESALNSKAGARACKEALRDLAATIRNAEPNVAYAGRQLVEQSEDVVTKARADIEAFVQTKAAQLGIAIEQADLVELPGLDA